MNLNQKLLAAFQIEHLEHLEGIRSGLAKCQQQGSALAGTDLDEAFRRAHSLKGAARIIGLTVVEALAHRLESLFSRLRDHSSLLDQEAIAVIHLTLDAIEDGVAASTGTETSQTSSRAMEELDRLLDLVSRPESPPAQRRAPHEEPSGQIPIQPTPDTVRLDSESLDRLLQSSGRLLAAGLGQDVVAKDLIDIGRQLSGMEKEWEFVRRGWTGAMRRLKDPPELAEMDRFIGKFAHRLDALTRDARGVRQLQQRESWTLRLLAEQLQEDVQRTRMVPAETIFQGFRKMMRDLARDAGNEIEFRTSGFDVEADRAVLQMLKDPLMHILRNAVSHGIESPEERASKEKPPMGLVEVRIEVVGNRLSITVEDDGRGVDLVRVTETAEKLGMVAPADASVRTASELLELLFQPGFSTASAVTELSGRGMGLSAAHEAVARLQGEVEIRPRQPAGTVVRLVVPLSVSTHRMLVVSCRDQKFAIPFSGIEILKRIKIQDLAMLEGKPVVSLDRQLVPVVTLERLLDPHAEAAGLEADHVWLVVLKSGGLRIAAAVDTVLVQREGLIQNLGPPASQYGRFLGGLLLEDGSVSLVLNPAELVDRFEPSLSPPQRIKPQSEDARTRTTILVVDDSFTTRTLETSLLEYQGYQVRVAVDGVEALDHLRSEKVDLVITDIQMPRLDGFGLLSEIKRDSRLARIPVIVVTSLDCPEDQERGLSLGADAYIVKRKFDHRDLLQTIQQLL